MNFYKEEKTYINFLIASLSNSIGNDILYFLIPWIILNLTNSTFWMGNIFLIQLLPSLIISPLVGFCLDRFSKQKIIFITNLTIFIILIFSFLYFRYFNTNIIIILFLTIVFSSLNSFSYIGEESIVINIVNNQNLSKANSLYQISETIASVTGPSIAGFLLMIMDVNIIFFIISLTFIPMIFISPRLKDKYTFKTQNNLGFITSIKTSLKFLKTSKMLLAIIVFCCILNISLGSVDSMFVYYSNSIIGLSSYQLGIIISLASFSQFVFSLISLRVCMFSNQIQLLLLFSILICFSIFILSFTGSFFLICLARMLQLGPVMIINVLNKTLRQRITPPEIIGQINAMNGTLAMITYPIAGFLSGLVCSFMSVRMLYLLSALFLMVSILITLILTSTQNRKEEKNVKK